MVFKELFSLAAAIVVLAGIAYAIAYGDSTARIIGASGDALASTIKAATPRGNG